MDDVVPGGTVTAPSTGMLVSWSVRLGASTQAQNIRIRVVRPAGNNTFTMIASGPLQPIPAGAGFYTFPLQLPINAGDRIAMDEDSATTLGWRADAPGARSFEYNPSPNDGGITDAPVFTYSDLAHNLSAVLVANNSFSVGAVTRNKKKGTATLTVNDIPNPGDLTGSGTGATVASAAMTSKAVTPPGPVTLTIKAKGKKKRKLNETGKVKLNVAITYTPTGGDPNTKSVKLKLKKKL